MIDEVEWALEWNWIPDYKWLYSEKEGRDIGTPETVDRMIRTIYGLKPQHRIPLIEGYLLGPEMSDFDGANQLEGELRRFVTQKDIQPTDVVLHREHVVEYCTQYDLGSTTQKLIERLEL